MHLEQGNNEAETHLSLCVCVSPTHTHTPPSFLLIIASKLLFFHKHANVKEFPPRDPAGWAAGPSRDKRGGEYHIFFPNPMDVYVWAGHSGSETRVKSVTYCGEGSVCHTQNRAACWRSFERLGGGLEFGLGAEEQQSIERFAAGFKEPHGPEED